MYQQKHNKLTIGSCCLSEFKRTCFGEYDKLFPSLTSFEIERTLYGYDNYQYEQVVQDYVKEIENRSGLKPYDYSVIYSDDDIL